MIDVDRKGQAEREAMRQKGAFGAAFLLSQLGFESSRLWRERRAPHGLGAREALLLFRVANHAGQPQHALATSLGVSPSLIVGVVDTLAKQGLIERRALAHDRRTRPLHVTAKGRRVVAGLLEEARAHENQMLAGLRSTERKQLVELLDRIAAERGLQDDFHPGFADKSGKSWGRGGTP
jgi:DNA-binding MarR family transcriptional regulator